MTHPKNILSNDGEVYCYPEFFSPMESDHYFDRLMKEIAWRQEPVKIFGKMVMQPRLTAWYGDPGKQYSYSGITMMPQPWTDTLQEIKTRIETVAPAIFNSALLNQYRNEQDSVGWHRDNEKSLGINPVIGSVSFGAPRTFQLRHHQHKNIKHALLLTHGSLLVMQGQTQHRWEHCIPKQSHPIGPRINITFRRINTEELKN